MITLDSSAAWQSAKHMVAANRDVLGAIAGVFFVLPGLIAAVVLPVPQLTSGMDQQQLTVAVMHFYTTAAPIMLVLSLPMLAGYLTLLVMLLDRDRPTVGTAIGHALRLLPSYVAAQLLTGMVLSALWLIVVGILAVMLPPLIAALASLVAMIYPLLRIVLIGPEMVAQRLRNPVRAIIAGLSRTRGHGAGLLLFLAPALTLFFVIYGLVMIFFGAILLVLTQGEVQRLISEAIGAVLFAAGYTYFTAIIASTYQQLGPITRGGEAIGV